MGSGGKVGGLFREGGLGWGYIEKETGWVYQGAGWAGLNFLTRNRSPPFCITLDETDVNSHARQGR